MQSVLILGSDTIAAASPATAVQLVHACHRWGFSTVIPSSWGDELLAAEVIRRCAARENRPAIQCSCPRVADRLGANAAKLDDAVFWLATPPVATAQYVRAHANGAEVHITYAGGCPGAIDASIDQRMTPAELLLAIGSRGIDLGAQPTVFDNIIPPDRRRHLSGAAGTPDAQRLWESSAFRVAQPSDIDLTIGVAQLLLGEERVLIDMAPMVGCVCRATSDTDPASSLKAPSPIVREGIVEVGRAPPVLHSGAGPATARIPPVDLQSASIPDMPIESPARRNSPAKAVFRRQSVWRRQTPRPGVVVTRASAVVMTVAEPKPFLKRTEVRVAIGTLVAVVASFMIGFWMG